MTSDKVDVLGIYDGYSIKDVFPGYHLTITFVDNSEQVDLISSIKPGDKITIEINSDTSVSLYEKDKESYFKGFNGVQNIIKIESIE